ncbi:hypothetical protein, partial [Chryseobacterium sp. CH1]|uniref:hypothetical protein n=1 Tax=Chryseobacterium sp. CH1 TaxID=713551 RepID=UPI001024D93F
GSYGGYSYEGTEFNAFLYKDQYLIDNKVYMEFNTIPIYRYYNGVDHYYTKTPGKLRRIFL